MSAGACSTHARCSSSSAGSSGSVSFSRPELFDSLSGLGVLPSAAAALLLPGGDCSPEDRVRLVESVVAGLAAKKRYFEMLYFLLYASQTNTAFTSSAIQSCFSGAEFTMLPLVSPFKSGNTELNAFVHQTLELNKIRII